MREEDASTSVSLLVLELEALFVAVMHLFKIPGTCNSFNLRFFRVTFVSDHEFSTPLIIRRVTVYACAGLVSFLRSVIVLDNVLDYPNHEVRTQKSEKTFSYASNE